MMINPILKQKRAFITFLYKTFGKYTEDTKSEAETACLYKAKKGDHFNAHFHREDELCTVHNKGGRVRVITPKWNKIVEFPNGVFIPRNTIHYIEFLEDTTLFCTWRPASPSSAWRVEFVTNLKTVENEK